MKECKECHISKEIDDFYKHSKMTDGHLSICKECKKKYQRIRDEELKKDPEFVLKEQRRHRDKYHRLNYLEKHKPSVEDRRATSNDYRKKYPEKYHAHVATSKIRSPEGHELHHWSYNEDHFLDYIILKVKEHYKAHRFLKYDKFYKMYRTMDGCLLDTREKHEAYIGKVFEMEC